MIKKDHGTFSGNPETEWLTEEDIADRNMLLLELFSFTDPNERVWTVPKGYRMINGASIPRLLWAIVGAPFVGDYRRASIVHDYAVEQAAGDAGERRAADRMFYHACRAGGCSWWQATIMYIGVRIGAAWPDVARWNHIKTDEIEWPRLYVSSDERLLLDDFRHIAELVFSKGETDDPLELEYRVNDALGTVTGHRFTSDGATHRGTTYQRRKIMSNESLISGPLVGHVSSGSAVLWVLARAGSQLHVRYSNTTDQVATSPAKQAVGDRSPLLFHLTRLIPSSRYQYTVEDPRGVLASGSFRTAPPQNQPTGFRFALSSCMKAQTRGRHKDLIQEPWLALRALNPDFQLLLGDNVYANSTKPKKLWKRHLQQRSVANFAEVIRNTPTYALWDDHDFAGNNSTGDIAPARKQATLGIFKKIWANPFYGQPETEGVFTRWQWGNVAFYLLDGRYHRSNDRDTMLGENQFQWLEEQLANAPGYINFIGSGSTLDDKSHGWARFPVDRERLLSLCERYSCIYLGGDRHCCGFTYRMSMQGKPLIEIISSGIGRKRKGNNKKRCVKALQRFVIIDVDTYATPASINARIIDKNGNEHGSMLVHRTPDGLKIISLAQGPEHCNDC